MRITPGNTTTALTIDYSAAGDAELVAAAQSGENGAFAELFRRHRLKLIKLATSILKNSHDAEEEVQISFFKAYQNIGRFQGDARFTTWMNRIVINQCLMRLRSAKRRRSYSIDDAPDGGERGTLELRDARATPEAKFGREQVISIVRNEIRGIPPLLRDVLVMTDIEQRPAVDVAQHLNITLAAAKSRLLRARRVLRERISRHAGMCGRATLLTESAA